MKVSWSLRPVRAGLAAAVLAISLTPLASAQELCRHPYFPVTESAEWTYRAGMPDLPMLMGEDVIRSANLTATGFEQVRRVSDAGTIVRRWTCTPEGLTDRPGGGTVTADDAPTAVGVLSVDDSAGMTLPRADLWQPGYTWTQATSSSFSGLNVVPGTQPRSEGAMTTRHTIVGQESVSVPAGVFQAWRLDSVSTGEVTVTIGGVPDTFEVTTTTTAWYVENVGMIKSTSSLDEMVVELMELISYQP